RAVGWRNQPPQRRRRRPHRRRQQPAALRPRADRFAARLRERAAVVRAAREAGSAGHRHADRAARTAVQGKDRAHRRVDRRGDAHHAGGDRAAEPRGHAAARRLRPGGAVAAAKRRAHRSGQRGDVPCRRAARSRGRRRRARDAACGETGSQLRRVDRGARRRLAQRPPGAEPARLAERGRRRRDRRCSGKDAEEVKHAAAILAALVAGCASPPRYAPPKPDLPVAWKIEAPFRESGPNDAAPKGRWWERFGDAKLNELVGQALAGSPTLAVAGLRLVQARASYGVAASQMYPQVGLFTRYNRFRITENRPLTNNAARNFSTTQNDFTFGLTASYEVDVGARVSSLVSGASASIEQSTADLENVRLLLVADLATAYFNLRQTDVELGVLASSIDLQRRSLDLAQTRHQLGAGTGLDVAQQQALIDTTLTQVDVLKRQRAQ